MWMLILVLPVFLGLLAMGLYGAWNNRQAEKYEEWKKQQEAANPGAVAQ
jgi:flagellar basal body-associated protein FliL